MCFVSTAIKCLDKDNVWAGSDAIYSVEGTIHALSTPLLPRLESLSFSTSSSLGKLCLLISAIVSVLPNLHLVIQPVCCVGQLSV